MSGRDNRDAARCPRPDGSLCGTCPDCVADAANDAQWGDGGIPPFAPERPAASTRTWWEELRDLWRAVERERSVTYDLYSAVVALHERLGDWIKEMEERHGWHM